MMLKLRDKGYVRSCINDMVEGTLEFELYDFRCERDFVGLCVRDGSYSRTGRAHFTNEQVTIQRA